MSIGERRISEVLEAIAAKTPAPGGGAVAAVTLGLSASLAAMVVVYSRGKKKLAAHERLFDESMTLFDDIRTEAIELADQDAAAYARLNTLQALEAENPKRASEWAEAVNGAIDVPQRILERALSVLQQCDRLTGRSNEWLKSDLAIAAVLGEAAGASAAWNVRINLPLVEDAPRRQQLETHLENTLREMDEMRQRVENACR